MKRWMFAAPVAALVLFGVLAGQQLLVPKKGDFERVSRNAPTRMFDTMAGDPLRFAPSPNGEPVIVNLFASWCAPCELEHKYLMALSSDHPDQLYGVLYKDKVENGTDFLERLGNPYKKIALDPDGQGGLDFGLTGVPETFVLSASGEILLHITGPLDEARRAEVSEALKAPR